MAGSLLSHRINQLLLNANAAFPSQVQDAKQMIKEWRHEQRCRIVRSERSTDHRGAVNSGGPVGVGTLEEK